MTADTPAVLVIRDGSSPPVTRNLGGSVDASNTFYPEHTLRSDGNPVGAAAPLPVGDAVGNAALGTPADVAWSGSGSSSIVAALKALWVAIKGTLTVSLTGTLPDTSSNGIQATANATAAIQTSVAGTLKTGVPTLTYTGAASASVATTSGLLVAAGTYTRALQIQTLPGSTTNVWLRVDGGVAAVSTGVLVAANGGSVSFGAHGFPIPTGAINAITDGASAQTVLLVGG